MTADRTLWEQRLEEAVVGLGPNGDRSHDLAHAKRVLRTALALADSVEDQGEGPVDRLVVTAAAYLHDIVAIEKNDPRRSLASRLSAAKAREILRDLDFPAESQDGVAHAIEAHSFSAGIAPRSLEARILQDADRMESLGAIGLARTFYVAGRLGSALFHDDDPLAFARPLDETTYALDHFFTKLLTLPATMTTAPGRAMAGERAELLRTFAEALAREVSAPAAPERRAEK
ncbi:hydrolase [Rhodospirillum rubrum]|uniref:HD domain-containing protein n=1 Tax=Rhodospirillum rubrum TaxID=1085 RepID=UPI001ED28A5C|nr:HD domain-containing protein [Rhodospirillum rubrum]MBK1664646.1 hydrolase [Rhodospirillum rubrum]MBK1676327.1 hydrolase [Rhodospirillum rubrum]